MRKLTILYDNWCPNCTRFVNFIHQFDWLNLLDIKELRNEGTMEKMQSVNYDLAFKQMASFDEKWNYGFDSLYRISLRIPIFWISIPFLFVLKFTKIGDYLYNQLAVKRKIIPLHCDETSCEI